MMYFFSGLFLGSIAYVFVATLCGTNRNCYESTITDAFERSGFDLAPCKECGYPVVCIPDGLPFCETCANALRN